MINGGRSIGVPSSTGARFGSPTVSSVTPSVRYSGNGNGYRSSAASQNVARVNNLWTQQTGAGIRPRVSPNYQSKSGVVNSGDLGVDSAGQTGSGTHLYPGSYGSNLPAYNGGRYGSNGSSPGGHQNGDHSRRYRGRSFYYPYYGYGYNYYPYIGSYYGGSTGYYPGYATAEGLNADASLTPELSTYDGGSQPSPQESGGGNPSAVVPPGAAQVDAPYGGHPAAWIDQQAAPRPATPRGPDSLVEAVQSELANRGYFKGKVDAMFGDDTKAAIGRFQKDNQLAVTGLVNNATLTMLGLN
jgi:hypothetical protein